jgi:hypothetical protein
LRFFMVSGGALWLSSLKFALPPGYSLSITPGMLAAHGAMPQGVTIQAPSVTPVAQAGAGHQV